MRGFSGRTRNLCVIGWPIAHSLSPAMQNAAIRAAGLDYAYTAMPVRPEALPEAVAGLRSLGFRGFNVTIPHKTAILPLLDGADEDARRIGAVNTVVCEADGRLLGYNTDAAGFLNGLSGAGVDAAGRYAVVFGAGGAARAALWGLRKAGAQAAVAVRDAAKARAALSDMPGAADEIFSWNDEAATARVTARASLFVNATPLGMTPHTDEAPPVDWRFVAPEAFFYDIVYTPSRTRFLREAEARGHRVLNGAAMLVGQGAAAFERWTGVRPDTAAMEEALLEALRRGA